LSYTGFYLTGGVGPLNYTYGPAQSSSNRRQSSNQGAEDVLGKDAFLRLLTTQLRYQDPLKPVEDQDFIAQMAQFTALEQMQNLTRQFELFIQEQQATNRMAQAMSLLGRNVEVQGEIGTYVGAVEAVRMLDGVPHLVVGGILFGLDDVVKVLS